MGQSVSDISSVRSVSAIKSIGNLRLTALNRQLILRDQFKADKLAKNRKLDLPTFKPQEFRDSLPKALQKSSHLSDVPLIRGKYKALNILGKGQYGVVLRVEDVHKNEFFALKCFSMESKEEDEDEESESFATEIEIMKLLDHDNIVNYVESFILDKDPLSYSKKIEKKTKEKEEKNEFLCLVMEYVQGGSMDHLLTFSEKAKFHLPGEVCIQWLITLLEVLEYCHVKGVVHRDIKPDNILVKYESLTNDVHEMKLVLTDFGVGKAVNIRNTDLKKDELKLEADNTGHLFYAPLEVLREEGHDFRYDVYSLGVVFFQMYFGVSTKSYQSRIFKFVPRLKKSAEFGEKFKKEVFNEDGEWDPCDFITFLHENGIYKSKYVDKFANEDPAIAVVLDLMMTQDLPKRATVKHLLDHPIIKTWRVIVERRNGKKGRIGEWIDFSACVTFFQVITKEESQIDLFTTLLDVMIEAFEIANVKKKWTKKVVSFFKDEDGFPKLFNKFILLDGLCVISDENDMDEGVVHDARELECLSKMLHVMNLVFDSSGDDDRKELINIASSVVRTFCFVEIISRYLISGSGVKNESRIPVLRFITYLAPENGTLRTYLVEMVFLLIHDYLTIHQRNESFEELIDLMVDLVKILVPYVSPFQLEEFSFGSLFEAVGKFPSNVQIKAKQDLLRMFSMLDWRKQQGSVLIGNIFSFLIFPEIDRLVKSENVVELNDFLEGVLRNNIVENGDVKEKKIPFPLSKSWEGVDNTLKLINENEEFDEDYVEFVNESRGVKSRSLMKVQYDENEKEVSPPIESLVVSDEYLCTIGETKTDENEEFIGFYEFNVVDGGDNDMARFGIILDYQTAYYLDTFQNTIVESNIDGYSELDIVICKENKRIGNKIFVTSVKELVTQMNENLDVSSMEFLDESNEWIGVSSADIPKNDEFLLRIIEKEVEENEIDDEFFVLKQKKVRCMTGDTFGVGVTNKGNFVTTKNGELCTKINLEKLKEKGVRVSAFFKFFENNRFYVNTRFEYFKYVHFEKEILMVNDKDRKKFESKLTRVVKKFSQLEKTCERIKIAFKRHKLLKKSRSKKRREKKK